MPEEPIAVLLASWTQATERYLSTWNTALEAMAKFPPPNAPRPAPAPRPNFPEAFDVAGEEQQHQAAIELSREVLEPLVQLAGGIPFADFAALTAQVERIHDRLDEIEAELKSSPALKTPSMPKQGPKRKKGKKKRS